MRESIFWELCIEAINVCAFYMLNNFTLYLYKCHRVPSFMAIKFCNWGLTTNTTKIKSSSKFCEKCHVNVSVSLSVQHRNNKYSNMCLFLYSFIYSFYSSICNILFLNFFNYTPVMFYRNRIRSLRLINFPTLVHNLSKFSPKLFTHWNTIKKVFTWKTTQLF